MADMMAKNEMAQITILFVNKTLSTSKTTMHSANKLFKKCAKIGTRILSVFRYRIAMQIAKTNAEIMLPKVCIAANKSELSNMEIDRGITNLNLFNMTPLKINSSERGETITVAIKLPIATIEAFKCMEERGTKAKKSKPGKISKIKFEI